MRRNRRRNRRRRRLRRLFRNRRRMGNRYRGMHYFEATYPTTFGPGSQVINITRFTKAAFDEEGNFDLDTIISTSPEYTKISGDFKYFKVEGFTVTFYPRQVFSEQSPLYFVVNYDYLLVENIRYHDNVKIVGPLINFPKIFKYRVPMISSNGVLLSGWINKADLYTLQDIRIQLFSPNNTNMWDIRFDVRLACRGPTLPQSSEMNLKEMKQYQELRKTYFGDREAQLKEKIVKQASLLKISEAGPSWSFVKSGVDQDVIKKNENKEEIEVNDEIEEEEEEELKNKEEEEVKRKGKEEKEEKEKEEKIEHEEEEVDEEREEEINKIILIEKKINSILKEFNEIKPTVKLKTYNNGEQEINSNVFIKSNRLRK